MSIIILHDSLGILKSLDPEEELQKLNGLTTQNLLDILSSMGYTHIYLIDDSCNGIDELSGYVSNNNNSKLFKSSEKYKQFQTHGTNKKASF